MEKGIILNGTSSIAVAKQDDLVYRLQPVRVVVPIVMSNLEAYTNKIFELNNYLNQDYQVVGATIDLAYDDDSAYEEGGETGGGSNSHVVIREVKNDKVLANMYYAVNENGIRFDAFFLNHDNTLVIQSSQKANSLTLYCVPVVLEKAITLGL